MRGEEFLEAARRRKESIQVKGEHQDLLKFSLGQEWYGIGIENVVEVRECPRIFNIPHTPDHVLGVVNLKGEILSIIDIRRLLGLSTSRSADREHIIVVERNNMRVGIMADRASGVVSVPDSDIKSELSMIDSSRSRLIAGEAQLALFSIGLEFQGDLDSKDIKSLMKEFKNKGVLLSDNATVSIEETGDRWLITDARCTVYSIRREEDRLHVYSGEVLGILDLDALMEE